MTAVPSAAPELLEPAVEHPVLAPGPGWATDYRTLMKPRITLLVVLTTLAAMVWAADGAPPVGLTLATLLGMTLASGGASALNHVWDRDIDRLMTRTQERPVAAGRITPRAGAVFGVTLNVAAACLLVAAANPLTAALAMAGSAFYVVVYTMVLKRRTPQNIVIGGAAGAVPPLVGWAAVTGEVGLAPVLMFLIIFFWTPPHFWALAILARSEYARAGVPMLPVVRSERETGMQILVYTVILAAVSILPYTAGLLGVVYLVSAALLGLRFLQLALRLVHGLTPVAAKATFLWSLVYLALLFTAMGVDRALAAA
jgi:protoheme IX farnesyltransferase